jgi:hypothetical protein
VNAREIATALLVAVGVLVGRHWAPAAGDRRELRPAWFWVIASGVIQLLTLRWRKLDASDRREPEG